MNSSSLLPSESSESVVALSFLLFVKSRRPVNPTQTRKSATPSGKKSQKYIESLVLFVLLSFNDIELVGIPVGPDTGILRELLDGL